MADPETPTVGSDIVMQVVQSPTRTTIFPEQTIVASPTPDSLELIFLRQELQMIGQQGVVRSTDLDSVNVEVKGARILPVLTDIGHARLPVQAAVDLAINVLRHTRDHHSVDIKAALATLTLKGRRPK